MPTYTLLAQSWTCTPIFSFCSNQHVQIQQQNLNKKNTIMASKTTMTSSTVSETKSTTTITTTATLTAMTSTSSTVSKTVATPTDSFVQKTDETASTDDITRMTTDTAIATSHYHQKQDESQQHQKAQSSVAHADVAAADTIQTLNELLSLPSTSSMELCQIELIYRAEGNANLVLALPQFKKVLRLPKSAITSSDVAPQKVNESKFQQQTMEGKEQQPHKQAQKASATTKRTTTDKSLKVDLTMKDFIAYMQIFQQLLGSGFVLDADLCWIPREADRKWINTHISSARPPHRLDKEFCGPFGLLLPDATQLPMQPLQQPTPSPLPSIQKGKEADILHANLQPLEKLNKEEPTTTSRTSSATITTAANTLTPTASATFTFENNTTYAIEIKPKQGWLLLPNPNTRSYEAGHVNVNDLFDIRQPTAAAIATSTATSSTPTAAKVAKTTDARCRYCAMQFLKLKNRKISNLSSYCPIELFSGVPSRMLAALDALFRCPQNNLRVFKNGILIYGDHASSISYDQLCDDIFHGDTFELVKNLVVECLLRDYNDNDNDDAIETSTATFIDTKMVANVNVVVGQPHSSVTATVESGKDQTTTITTATTTTTPKTEQMKQPETETKASNRKKKQETQAEVAVVKTKLEKLTTPPQGTAPATTKKTTMEMMMATKEVPPSQAQINEAERQCLPKNCILQKILHLQLFVKHNLDFMQKAEFANYTQKTYQALNSLLSKTTPVTFENLSPSEQYLLGATALDCSIMIAFQKYSEDQHYAENIGKTKSAQIVNLPNTGLSFRTKVTVLDLDPKPDSHFSKYLQQTKEAYAELKI